jgi:hypothetical protein
VPIVELSVVSLTVSQCRAVLCSDWSHCHCGGRKRFHLVGARAYELFRSTPVPLGIQKQRHLCAHFYYVARHEHPIEKSSELIYGFAGRAGDAIRKVRGIHRQQC